MSNQVEDDRRSSAGVANTQTEKTDTPKQQQQQQQPQPQSTSYASSSSSQLENIKVAVRLRPFTEREKQRNSKRIVDIEQNTVALYNPKSSPGDLSQSAVKKFTFDYSYWSHDGFKRNPVDGVNVPDEAHLNHSKYVGQERVFEDLGAFLLENALQGYNSALLAYGQTGSGKSYTVSGYGQNEGIVPRFARALFVELEKRAAVVGVAEAPADQQVVTDEKDKNNKNRYEVYFSMIEIYNEVVRDLLAQDHQVNLTAARRGLKVREHPKRGFFVEGLTSYACQNKDEIERRIEEGQLNKSIAATSMNETSSRGHTIYEFRIRQYRPNSGAGGGSGLGRRSPGSGGGGASESVITSVVQLVDLAGSERLAVHVTGQLGGDSFIASRSSSPFGGGGGGGTGGGGGSPRLHDDLQSNSNTLGRARSVAVRKVTPTSASSTASSSTATTNANQHQQQQLFSSSIRRQAQQAAGNLHVHDNHQQRFKESVSINQSLSALGNCIQVLSQYSQQMDSISRRQQQQQQGSTPSSLQQQQPKIPYRDSVLTKLLNRCCLSGNSKVVIIATLSPADANYDDTLSTLRFADRAKQIKTHAQVNRTNDGALNDIKMVNDLQKENQRLKRMIDGSGVTRSDDSSQTSNFDDTENMIDNFNGPAGSSNSGPPPPPPTVGSKSAQSKQTSSSTSSSSGAGAGPGRGRSTMRRPTGRTANSTATGAPATGGHRSKSRSQRLANSTSNPALVVDETQMRRIVSPASKKLTREAEDKTEVDGAPTTTTPSKGSIKKSRSTGTGLAPAKRSSSTNKRVGSYVIKHGQNADEDGLEGEGDEGEEEDDEDVDDEDIELAAVASNLLDEIDLNELADIDEGGLLSPDSDDSLAALAEENLTNEEKISILNKLLSNSNVAYKIRKQYELQHKNLLQQARPNRRLANHRLEDEHIQRVSAISSSLKQTNPYLSNLNQDEQLTGMIAYIIKQGQMIVGKNSDCDILLYGPELRGRHAKITREEVASGSGEAQQQQQPTSRVFIEPIDVDEASPSETDKQQVQTNLMVNGNPVPVNERQQLHHCDRILFGSNAYFVFIDQASAGPSATLADQDLVTYDMAHNEALRKVMSEAKIEAVIKDINNYTHRPGTGKHKAKAAAAAVGANHQESPDHEQAPLPKLSNAKGSRLMRSLTIQDDHREGEREGEQQPHIDGVQDGHPTDKIEESPNELDQEQEDYRQRLMEDTYEYAMPVAEVNAIAKEMQIKVTYGLKILTGEEQLPEPMHAGHSNYMDSNGSDDQSSLAASSINGADNKDSPKQHQQQHQQQPQSRAQSGASYEHQPTSTSMISNSIRPETLDIPPALYIHVHLEEQMMDFYWSKEKFQARRFKILELYGAWDVGGKSGLVEYLIEQSKYQSDYMIDPFIDDPQLSQVLVGHAQVSLEPISHGSDLNDQTYDILDLNDELAGSISLQVIPCRPTAAAAGSTSDSPAGLRPLTEQELSENLVHNPRDLLGKRLAFLIKIVCCRNISEKYRRVYCQYTLNRDTAWIRTNLARELDLSNVEPTKDDQRPDLGSNDPSQLDFNHSHYVLIEQVNQDHLDFFQHGFLAIQVVAQYSGASSANASASNSNNQQLSSTSSSSAVSSAHPAPTLITTIINSINKYKFRMEQQLQHQRNGNNFQPMNNNYSSSIYTNSATDSAKSQRVASSSAIMNSNSGASSVASTSATVNLFDQQNDDDEGINSMNGLSQENIIDMILTKRKLDRAENQLHYLKRTINIAEHYNKKHIPVKTVKKLLNSYGHEIESGSIEEMVADANVKGRVANSKHSACIVQ